jgi:hypothetical protein
VLAGTRKVLELDLPGTARMIETARLKAAVQIALCDCFAIATARSHGLTLLTGNAEILARDVPARSRTCAARRRLHVGSYGCQVEVAS